MEQEHDFIKREIEKLTMALMKLIDKTASVGANNFEAVVFETNEKLAEYFGLSLEEMAVSDNSRIMSKIDTIDNGNLEKIIELVYRTVLKAEQYNVELELKTKELSEKLLLMIDLVDKKTKSFSVERMNMKTKLIQINNRNK